MCCFVLSVLMIGPRLGVLVWYLFSPAYVNGAFDNFIWGFLGWLFLPWTTLMYIAIYPGGIMGFDWLLARTGRLCRHLHLCGRLSRAQELAVRRGDPLTSVALFTARLV